MHSRPWSARKGEAVNKMLYVRDEDASLFDQAQQLTGMNASATVVHALKELVRREDLESQGFKEVRSRIYRSGTTQIKRFHGHRALSHRFRTDAGEIATIEIYRTPKGNLAVYARYEPDWTTRSKPADGNLPPAHDPTYEITSSLDVYEDEDSMLEKLPEEVIERYQAASAEPEVVDLDI